jgi:hydroxymethylglutaryl-CoA lyase
MGSPYEGDIPPENVAHIARRLHDMGCYEISLGDTIGVGTPTQTKHMLDAVGKQVPMANIGIHFHDTYGQALANIYAALDYGIASIDSAIAGLGGCPYANGASGNVATEDLLYMLNGMAIDTGVNMDLLLKASAFVSEITQRPVESKVANALLNG